MWLCVHWPSSWRLAIFQAYMQMHADIKCNLFLSLSVCLCVCLCAHIYETHWQWQSNEREERYPTVDRVIMMVLQAKDCAYEWVLHLLHNNKNGDGHWRWRQFFHSLCIILAIYVNIDRKQTNKQTGKWASHPDRSMSKLQNNRYSATIRIHTTKQ